MPNLGQAGLPKPPSLKNLARLKPMEIFGTGRPPSSRIFSSAPIGPRYLNLGSKRKVIGGGPGEPPVGFVTPHTSATEWVVYWALSKMFKSPINPWKGPFTGDPLGKWGYQSPAQGGRNAPGGSVTDFWVDWGGKIIGVRVETEFFHVYQTATVQQRDFYLRTHITSLDSVVAVYDQYLLADPSGQGAIKHIAAALKGDLYASPQGSGTAVRIR